MSNDANIAAIPIEREELIARLRWFIRLRWIAGAGVVTIGLVMHVAPLDGVRGNVLAALGAAILAYNWVFWYLDRRLHRLQPDLLARRAPAAALAQIVLDLVALTLVLHGLGGIENPLFVYYIFHIVIATLLLSGRAVFALAALAIGLLTALAAIEMHGGLPHTNIGALQGGYRDASYVALTLLAFASALVIAVYLGTSIAATLRMREREIVRLEREVEARAEALEQANASLRAADEAKTQYFRLVSHELKAPIAAQQSLLQALLITSAEVPEGFREHIGRAIRRGNELLALVGDLLMLSRARDVTRQSKPEWIDPAERVRAVVESQALAARDKGVSLDVQVDEAIPSLWAEPGLLTAIVENLVSNAIKYTPAGGSVTISLRNDEGHLVLAVRDTGVGIAPEDLHRVGEDFFRTRQARQSGEPGTGLGMAIVRSIVTGLRGALNVQSELGRGTTVTVRLPLGAESASGEKYEGFAQKKLLGD